MQLAEQYVGHFNLSDYIKTDPDVKETNAAAEIGPEGGIVSVTDSASPICGTSLKVPAGALDAPVRISIREGDHSCAFGLGPSIKLLPCGLQFKRIATLTVHLGDNYTTTSDDLEELVPAIYHFDETINQWAHNSTAGLERLGNAVLCELRHL